MTDKLLHLSDDIKHLPPLVNYQFALKAARLGAWTLNPGTDQLTCDDSCRDLLGLTSTSVALPAWLDHVHPDDRTQFSQAIQQIQASKPGDTFDQTYRVIDTGGAFIRWVRLWGQVASDHTGLTIEVGGVAQAVAVEPASHPSELDTPGAVKQALERALRESEERFRAAIGAVQGVLWTNNAKGEMTGPQPGWGALTGQSFEEYQGYGWSKAVHPDDAQPTINAWEEALRKQQAFIFEHRVWVKEGRWELFSIRALPVFNSDGSIREWVGVHTNITERRQAEQALQESKMELAFAIDATELGVWDLNPLTNHFKGNERLKDWFGLRPDETIDLNLALESIVDEDRERVANAIARTMVFESGGRYDIEYTIINRHTGQKRIVRAKGRAHFTSNQTVYRFNGTLQDITERKQAEEALRVSEAKLQSVLAAAPVAIGLFTGRDLVIELHNQAFADFVGKGPDIAGRPLREVMPELISEKQPTLPVLEQVYTSGKKYHHASRETKVMRNGVMTRSYYNVTYTPLVNEAGEVYAVLDMAVDVTGQILAQQELEEQKTYLQTAIDIADLGTYYIDVASGGGNCTDNIRNWFNLTDQSQMTSVIQEKIHPDDRSYIAQKLAESVRHENNSRHDLTFRVVDSTGAVERHLRSIGKAMYINGRPATISGIIQDVTPQVMASQQLKDSENRFRSLIEEAPVASCLFVGRDMRVDIANDTMLGYWGKSKDVIGLPLAEAVPELVGQPFLQILNDIYTSGQTYEAKSDRAELMLNGVLETYYFDFTYKPLRNAAGEIYAIMDTAVDVTQEVTARQKIEEAEAALRGAVELAELSTWSLDIRRGTITYSQRFMEWLGFSEDTQTLDESYTPFPGEYRESVPAALAEACQPGGTGLYENEHPIVNRQTGQVRIIHAQAHVLYDENGAPAFLNGTAQDVTQQRRRQEELERQVQERTEELEVANVSLAATNEELEEFNQLLKRSNDNLQQFAYVASHDLQEPLRKIQSFGDLLHVQYAGQLGEGVDMLARMQQAANRMSLLIKDLLTYSRISTRQEAATPVRLNDTVQGVLQDLDMVIAEKKAQVTIDPLPTIAGDRSQLGQLFQNLLSNALKFQQKDSTGVLIPPQIQVRSTLVQSADLPSTIKPTRNAAAYYRIDVSDNGIGFDQKYTDRIFQVFQRLHGKNEFVGTGIGLAICEKVVANHGGAITATSQPGKGAMFSLYLPA